MLSCDGADDVVQCEGFPRDSREILQTGARDERGNLGIEM